jgi:hypothetical protein
LTWLYEEYYRYTDDRDLWRDLPRRPRWILEMDACNPRNDDMDPLIWHQWERNVWAFAEVAVDVYIFAQTFDIPRLRQDAMDRLLWCHNEEYVDSLSPGFIHASSIQKAYENTRPGSKLREILVYGWCEMMEARDLQEKAVAEALPREFLADIALHYVNNCGKEGCYGNIGGHEYHEHRSEEKRDCVVRVVGSLVFG